MIDFSMQVLRTRQNIAIKILHLVSALSLIISFAGCAETASLIKPSAFTEQNIDRLRIGMSANEVKEIFGSPNEVDTAVCGGATGHTWICETWAYQRGSSKYDSNKFTFSVSDNEKRLNNWSVKRN